MNKPQSAKHDYPEPFESEWESTGSRTIDPGQRFLIEVVNDSGYDFNQVLLKMTRETGPLGRHDHFGEYSCWPNTVLWSASGMKPGKLLSKRVRETDLKRDQVYEPVEYEFSLFCKRTSRMMKAAGS